MTKEHELLGKLVAMRDADCHAPLMESLALERELAMLYMPQVDPDISDSDLQAWGHKFKEIVERKVELFRQSTLVQRCH